MQKRKENIAFDILMILMLKMKDFPQKEVATNLTFQCKHRKCLTPSSELLEMRTQDALAD